MRCNPKKPFAWLNSIVSRHPYLMEPWPYQDRPHVLAKSFHTCPIPIRYCRASIVMLLTFLLKRKPNRARKAVSVAT